MESDYFSTNRIDVDNEKENDWEERKIVLQVRLSQCYDTDADSTLVRVHRRGKGPSIGFRIVNLDCREIRYSIVSSNGPKFSHVCH